MLQLISRRAAEFDAAPGPVDLVRAGPDLLTWDERRLREWWAGPAADAARQWEAAGRTGEDVADLVVRGLGPQDADTLADLTPQEFVRWCDSIGGLPGPAAIDRIQLWRSVGVPEPLNYLHRFHDWTPAAIRQWRAADFDPPAMLALIDVSPAQAIAWRGAGYLPAETGALLSADPMLTVDEADAFAAKDIPGPERISWLEWGFDAAQAKEFRDAGVRMYEARGWRELGLGPQDVRPGQQPPGALPRPWISALGDTRGPKYAAKDPPGTRGAAVLRDREMHERHLGRQARRRRREGPGSDN